MRNASNSKAVVIPSGVLRLRSDSRLKCLNFRFSDKLDDGVMEGSNQTLY
jgi:hypothetical protein